MYSKLLVVLCLCLTAGGQTIRITGGVADDQVVQRDARGRAALALSGVVEHMPAVKPARGKPPAPVVIEARLLRKHMPVPGFEWREIARAEGGKWSAELQEAPAGGPYRLEARVAGTEAVAAIHNVLIGDLWVLAGQSNMEGVGDLRDLEPPHDLVHSFTMQYQWVVAEEPLHRRPDAVASVHWIRNQGKPEKLSGERLAQYIANRRKGAGLGLPFAAEMVRRTGIPVGLLPCAHGGTSMDQWDPALKERGDDSLYGAMLNRVRAAGGRIQGVLWYQGESDANPKAAAAFAGKFERLVAALRQDFGQPGLPFYYVQIGRHISMSNVDEWNAVQEMQRQAEQTIPGVAMAAAVDFELDDGIHVGVADLKRLGKRLAHLATGGQRGPRPGTAVFRDGILHVTFTAVNGALRAPGRVLGFSLHNAKGEYLPLIYKARVDPADGSAVLLYIQGKIPEGAALHYGRGKDPVCNVRDAADMALPVFGPLPLSGS
jgi:sialate O-acetylesterase